MLILLRATVILSTDDRLSESRLKKKKFGYVEPVRGQVLDEWRQNIVYSLFIGNETQVETI